MTIKTKNAYLNRSEKTTAQSCFEPDVGRRDVIRNNPRAAAPLVSLTDRAAGGYWAKKSRDTMLESTDLQSATGFLSNRPPQRASAQREYPWHRTPSLHLLRGSFADADASARRKAR